MFERTSPPFVKESNQEKAREQVRLETIAFH